VDTDEWGPNPSQERTGWIVSPFASWMQEKNTANAEGFEKPLMNADKR
jgi:hypothetical protein